MNIKISERDAATDLIKVKGVSRLHPQFIIDCNSKTIIEIDISMENIAANSGERRCQDFFGVPLYTYIHTYVHVYLHKVNEKCNQNHDKHAGQKGHARLL